MTPIQIRAEMMLNNITVTAIARKLGVKQPTVSQVIYGVRPTLRIREAVATAIKKTVDEIWPEPTKEGK